MKQGDSGLALAPCGAPATIENGQTLCWGHRLQQDQATLPDDVDLAEGDHWRRRHRVRPGATPSKWYIPGEEFGVPSWLGCRVEILAFTLGEEGSGADTSRVLMGYPWHFERFPRMEGPCTIVRWRLYHPGKPGFLAVTWDAMRPPQERERRLIDTSSPRATSVDAARLFTLWPPRPEDSLPARWPRTSDTSGAEYVAERGTRLAAYCQKRGIDPMDLERKDVAEALGYASDESFRNALNQKKVRTEHIKAEAYRLIGENLA